MKVGIGLIPQNYPDWGRYTADSWDAPAQIPDADIYEDSLYLAQLAEELGLDSVWTAEHHFTPYIMVPNPVQFLTHIAGATRRLDVGSMVTVLTWHHPLRLAAEVAALDIMLGPDRRFHMGTGRGTSKLEFDAFEIDRNTTRARFAETLEVLRLALSNERFSHKGEYYEFGDVTVRPRPRTTRVLDDMLMAWGSAESLPVAANAGLKPLFIPQKGWSEMAAEMHQFNELRASNGWEPARSTTAIWTYVAPTREEAEEQGAQYSLEYADSTRLHYLIDKPEVFENTVGYERYGERAKAIAAAVKSGEDPAAATLRTMTSVQIIGSPKDCKEQLVAICESLGVEHFVGVFQFGTMPREHAERSMRLFTEHIAPALRQLTTVPV